MPSPNYLGTQTGLTGIPSALPSSMGQIQDPDTQKAIYQLQNWANSFFPWNYGFASGVGNYTTGGVTIGFQRPFPSNLVALTIGLFSFGGAAQYQIDASNVDGFQITLFNSSGAQLANGSDWGVSYMAIGH